MNRPWATDSKKSLDLEIEERDSVPMIGQPYQLYVERMDTAKNMARFYAMSIEATLFGDVCLTRRWGRIGVRGQALQHHFNKEEEAVQFFLELLRSKRVRGYGPRGLRLPCSRRARRTPLAGRSGLWGIQTARKPPRKEARRSSAPPARPR